MYDLAYVYYPPAYRANTSIIFAAVRGPYFEIGDRPACYLPHIQITYVISGSTKIRLNDSEEIVIKEGDILILDKGTFAQHIVTEKFDFFELQLNPKYFELYHNNASSIYDIADDAYFNDIKKRKNVITLSDEERKIMMLLISGVEKEIAKREICFDNMVNGYTMEIITLVLRSICNNSNYEKSILQVVDYINNNYTKKNLTIKSIANKHFYNSAYLGRVFAAEFGVSISDYISQKRIEHAKIFLTTTNMTSKQILSKVGFVSEKQFYKQFKKYSNDITPKQYKKMKSEG